MPHPLGVVIGDGVLIKSNVTIWQQVTIGGKRKKDGVAEYPEISEDVKIFAKASVIGGVKIGVRATVGAHALVIKDVAAGEVVAGVPATTVRSIR
jgi:serine O-acetyltransferase